MPICANCRLGGKLSNFQRIERNLSKSKKILKMEEERELAKLPKNKGVSIKHVMNKMHDNFNSMMKI
jgi:ribosomal protein S2